MVMDAQLRSVHNANAAKLGCGGSANSSIVGVGGSGGGTGSKRIDLHPHYISRRYAEFTCSILLILNKGNASSHHAISMGNNNSNSGSSSASSLLQKRQQMLKGGGVGGGKTSSSSSSTSAATAMATASRDRDRDRRSITSVDFDAESKTSDNASTSSSSIHNNRPTPSHRGHVGGMLISYSSLITEETICLLDRLADEQHAHVSKHRHVFLINNLDAILQAFRERKVQNTRETTRFVDLLMKQRELFVEEDLLRSYFKMVAFIQQTESHMMTSSSSSNGGGRSNSSSSNRLNLNEAVVESLLRDFALN